MVNHAPRLLMDWRPSAADQDKVLGNSVLRQSTGLGRASIFILLVLQFFPHVFCRILSQNNFNLSGGGTAQLPETHHARCKSTMHLCVQLC